MRIHLSSRGLFALGFFLVVITNLLVLLGVAFNRSGEPESRVTLTERELKPMYPAIADDGLRELHLNWRILPREEKSAAYSYGRWVSPVWFDMEKLASLGFEKEKLSCSKNSSEFYNPAISKEVFIVLEYDGELYGATLERLEQELASDKKKVDSDPENKGLVSKYNLINKRLQREQISESRLFAKDAGPDAGALRAKYPDRAKFIIARGLVASKCNSDKPDDISGVIKNLTVENIHVPFQYAGQLKPLSGGSRQAGFAEATPPRYEVRLAYGRRFEPWIVSISSLK